MLRLIEAEETGWAEAPGLKLHTSPGEERLATVKGGRFSQRMRKTERAAWQRLAPMVNNRWRWSESPHEKTEEGRRLV